MKGKTMFKRALTAGAIAAAICAPGVVFAADAAPDAKPADAKPADAKPEEPKSPHTFTGNVGLFSQYIFRGLTQTNAKPAIQGGFDYSHESGFYAGVWASNITWISDGYAPGSSYGGEFDTYLGWKFALPNDFGVDVGFLRYNYPGRAPTGGFVTGTNKADTNEIYAAGSWKWLSLKYSYSLGDTFGASSASGSSYVDLTAAIPIADSGFTVTGHVGHQKYDGTNAPTGLWPTTSHCTNSCLSYTDYKLGVNKEWLGLNFGLMWTKADTKGAAADGTAIYNNIYGKNIGDSTVTVSVQKTF
jgi:uncharacterized protein (TIGR02001 family)